MKNLLFVLMLLFFVSCDEQGGAYTDPQNQLTAAVYSATVNGEDVKVYVEGEHIYVHKDKEIYKTLIVSESDMIGISPGGLLLFITVGLCAGFLLAASFFR